MRRLALLPLLCLLSAPALADEVKRSLDEVDVGDYKLLGLHLPLGNVLLESGEGEALQLAMAIDCSSSSSTCRTKAEKLELVTQRQADRLLLKISGLTSAKISGLTVNLHLRAPRSMAVDMNIGTGNVAVRDFDQNLEIDVGVGDVEATMPKAATKSLEMDTGIGNIHLNIGDEVLRGAGMVGSHLDWSQGQGHAEVEVDCGVGDIEVTLR